MTFAICNLEKILSTWWKTIGRSVGRWPITTGQKRDRQDQRRADRSAWRHRVEARRVKAGRSVSRLFDTIMLQSCETPALRRDTHRSLFVISPFAYTFVTRERRPRIREGKEKKRWLFREKRRNLIFLMRDTLLRIYLSSFYFTSRVRPDIRNLCHEMKKSKMIHILFSQRAFRSSRSSDVNPMENMWSNIRTPRKVCVHAETTVPTNSMIWTLLLKNCS